MSLPTLRCRHRRSGARASSRESLCPSTRGCSTSALSSSASGAFAVSARATVRRTRNWSSRKAVPRLRYWLDRLTSEGILAHAAVVYGYFPAISEGDDVIVLTEPKPDAPERFRFTYPRQHRDRFLCIADFVRSRKEAEATGQVDVLPFQLVTMGQPIADFANELFASNSYRDYLEVHGNRRPAHGISGRVLASTRS